MKIRRTLLGAVLALTLTLSAASAATPYMAYVPDKTEIAFAGTETIQIGLIGVTPVHLGAAGQTNRDILVRFNVPACLMVVDAKPLQNFGPARPDGNEFGWAKTRSDAAADYVIWQRTAYPTGADATGGFDVAMAPLYSVTLKAVSSCRGEIDLKRVSLGMFSQATMLVDGKVEVAGELPKFSVRP